MKKLSSNLQEVWFWGAGNTASKAFTWLQAQKPEINLLVCSPKDDSLANVAQRCGVRWISIDEPLGKKLKGYPLIIISFLLPCKIPLSLISQSKYGGINFHPAPLPSYRGVRCATFAILNKEQMFGVTCHYMTKRFDDGPILGSQFVPIMSNDTAHSLETRSKVALLELFIDIFSRRKWEISPPDTCVHPPPGKLYTQHMFNIMACIENTEKCKWELYTRAFWNPPYSAAYINCGHKKYFRTPCGKFVSDIKNLG